MSYKTYITEAVVCGSYDNLTSDRTFLLFTREAGMVRAAAKSVREERSKHRYALQECSYARVTLVRGKSGWRVTGTEPIQNFYAVAQTREERAFVRSLFLLIRRVIQGETAHESVFQDLIDACENLRVYPLSVLDAVVPLRILSALGYIDGVTFPRLIEPKRLTDVDFAATTSEEIAQCRDAIAYALRESQL